jgi:hypothetical protein
VWGITCRRTRCRCSPNWAPTEHEEPDSTVMSELSGVPYSIYKHAVDCVSAPSASRRELIYVWWGFKSVGGLAHYPHALLCKAVRREAGHGLPTPVSASRPSRQPPQGGRLGLKVQQVDRAVPLQFPQAASLADGQQVVEGRSGLPDRSTTERFAVGGQYGSAETAQAVDVTVVATSASSPNIRAG